MVGRAKARTEHMKARLVRKEAAMALAEVMVQPVNEEKQTKSTPQDDEMSSAMAFRTRFMSSEQQQHEQQHEQEMRAHSDVHRNHFLESARVEVPMDRVFLRRVWEDVGRAWGWCALCGSPFAIRDVRNFGHFLGRGGVLDDFRRDRGTHRRCGKRFFCL